MNILMPNSVVKLDLELMSFLKYNLYPTLY